MPPAIAQRLECARAADEGGHGDHPDGASDGIRDARRRDHRRPFSVAKQRRGVRAGLFRVGIKDGRRKELALPPFGRDAVANIAQNPARRAEVALISFERAVFVSSDAGMTWRRIARPRGTLPGRN